MVIHVIRPVAVETVIILREVSQRRLKEKEFEKDMPGALSHQKV